MGAQHPPHHTGVCLRRVHPTSHRAPLTLITTARVLSQRQACHKTFRHVRGKVVFIQRAWRQRLQRILERDLDKGAPYDHDSFIVQHSVKTIQNAFRDMQFANEYYAQKGQQEGVEGVEVEPAR